VTVLSQFILRKKENRRRKQLYKNALHADPPAESVASLVGSGAPIGELMKSVTSGDVSPRVFCRSLFTVCFHAGVLLDSLFYIEDGSYMFL
jgi:hypothetical protein